MLIVTPHPVLQLAPEHQFWFWLGCFRSVWDGVEITTDYSIGHILSIPHEETHLITAGMTFGPKSKMLARLIGKSERADRAQLLDVLNKLRSSKRDLITHGYIQHNGDKKAFLDRNISQDFKAERHEYSVQEFAKHCLNVSELAARFSRHMEITPQELNDFTEAAMRISTRAAASRTKPPRKK